MSKMFRLNKLRDIGRYKIYKQQNTYLVHVYLLKLSKCSNKLTLNLIFDYRKGKGKKKKGSY